MQLELTKKDQEIAQLKQICMDNTVKHKEEMKTLNDKLNRKNEHINVLENTVKEKEGEIKELLKEI